MPVLATPSASQVHVSRTRSDLSYDLIRSGSLGHNYMELFAIKPVDQRKDLFWIFDPQLRAQDRAEEMTESVRTPMGGKEQSTGDYRIRRFAWGELVSDDVMDEASDQEDVLDEATMDASLVVATRIQREVTQATFKTGIWTGAPDVDYIASTSQSTGIEDDADQFVRYNKKRADSIQLRSYGKRPNCIAAGRRVITAIEENEDLKERALEQPVYNGLVDVAMISGNRIAKLLGCMDYPGMPAKLIPLDAIYDNSLEGEDANPEWDVDDALLMYYSPPGLVSRRTASAASVFHWRKFTGRPDLGTRIRIYRQEDFLSTVVACDMAMDVQITGPTLGAYTHNMLSTNP